MRLPTRDNLFGISNDVPDDVPARYLAFATSHSARLAIQRTPLEWREEVSCYGYGHHLCQAPLLSSPDRGTFFYIHNEAHLFDVTAGRAIFPFRVQTDGESHGPVASF